MSSLLPFSIFKLNELLIPIEMEQYYTKIMNEAKKVGMLVIYDNDAGYILVIKYWDSASGKVGGSKYPIAGEFAEGFLRFKRFFFDSTFDKIFFIRCPRWSALSLRLKEPQ